jgi:hypothetical protein
MEDSDNRIKLVKFARHFFDPDEYAPKNVAYPAYDE